MLHAVNSREIKEREIAADYVNNTLSAALVLMGFKKAKAHSHLHDYRMTYTLDKTINLCVFIFNTGSFYYRRPRLDVEYAQISTKENQLRKTVSEMIMKLIQDNINGADTGILTNPENKSRLTDEAIKAIP